MSEIKDIEIVRACAEMMGYEFHEKAVWDGVPVIHAKQPSGEWLFDPIHNDAQAMALVKKFHIQITKTLRTPDDPFGQWIATRTDKYMSGPTSDLNRAICECVSKLSERGRG